MGEDDEAIKVTDDGGGRATNGWQKSRHKCGAALNGRFLSIRRKAVDQWVASFAPQMWRSRGSIAVPAGAQGVVHDLSEHWAIPPLRERAAIMWASWTGRLAIRQFRVTGSAGL